jgi:hypothetical protein
MFIWEDVRVERKPYLRKGRAARQGRPKEIGSPRFLGQALAWVEFRCIALQRQRRDLMGGNIDDACEPSAESWGSLIL